MFIYKTLLSLAPRQLSSLSRLMIAGSKSTVRRAAATEAAGTEALLHGKLAKKVTPPNSSNHIAAKPPNSSANGNGKVGGGEPVEGKRPKTGDSEKGRADTGNQLEHSDANDCAKNGTQNGLGFLAKLDKKIDFSNNKATYLAPQFAALTAVFGAIIVGIIGIVLPIRYSNNELKKNNETLQNANDKLQKDLDSKNSQLTTTQGELTETKKGLGKICTMASVLRDEVDSLKRQESQSFLCNAFGLFCHNRPATENTSSDILSEESNDQIVRYQYN